MPLITWSIQKNLFCPIHWILGLGPFKTNLPLRDTKRPYPSPPAVNVCLRDFGQTSLQFYSPHSVKTTPKGTDKYTRQNLVMHVSNQDVSA